MRSARSAAALAAALALGLAVGALLANDAGELRALRSETRRLEERVARLEGERDRLRAERDQLEARLAAARAPAVCPQEFVSTGRLLPFFSVDYPCGWHVLYEPQPGTAGERPGQVVEIMLFSRLPVSLAPRPGALADIEVSLWSDDPRDGEDRLPPLAGWVDEERARFVGLRRDERVEAGGGITVAFLAGVIRLEEEETAQAAVALWEFEDTATGARHVVRAFALSPNTKTAQALERVARSFRVHPR